MTKFPLVPRRLQTLILILVVAVPTAAFTLYYNQEQTKKADAAFAVRMLTSTRELRDSGKWEEARQAAAEWIRLQPANRDAQREFGITSLETGDIDAALLSLQKATAQKPDDGLALSALGRLYFQQKKYAQAEIAFRRSLSQSPERPEASIGLARSLIAQNKDLDQAQALALKAAQTDAGSPLGYFALAESLLAKGKGPDARRAVVRGLALAPADSGGYLLLSAALRLSANPEAATKAETLAEAIQRYRPGDPAKPDPIRLAEGEQLLEAGKYREALAAFIMVARRDLSNAGALEGAGIALWQMNAAGSASAYLKEALRFDPERVRARVALGIVAYSNNLYGSAIQFLEPVTSLQPRNALAWHTLGLAYVSRLLHDVEAENALRKASELEPANAIYKMDLADTLKTNNKLPEAEQQYRQAINLAPADNEAAARFGAFLAQLPPTAERRQEAQSLLEKALKEAPDYAFAQYHLGRLLVEQGDYEKGAALLEEATAHGQGRTRDAWSVLARAYRKLGQKTKLLAALDQADRIQKENDRFERAFERLSSNMNDSPARLEMARASAQHGMAGRALAEYASYLRRNPKDQPVRTEQDRYIATLKAAGKYPDMTLFNNLNTLNSGGK